jgi:hypothetical protein
MALINLFTYCLVFPGRVLNHSNTAFDAYLLLFITLLNLFFVPNKLSGDNNLYTADDLEYEEAIRQRFETDEDGDGVEDDIDDFFGRARSARSGSADDGGDEKGPSPQEIAYREKQSQIKAELDSCTGRLWEERWTITDEDWLSTDTFDDIEDWSVKMATRKAVESVRVWDG